MDNNIDILITGDTSIDRFLYIEGFSNQLPNLRDAWVNARKFWNVTLDGGAGSLISYMAANDISAVDPCTKQAPPESIYLLTRRRDDEASKWYVDKAIVAGERDFNSSRLQGCLPDTFPSQLPVVILDFNQGWVNRNARDFQSFVKSRLTIIRSHDPCKEIWRNYRKNRSLPGVWFSPIQDMADGSLWIPGNWETLCKKVLEYLKNDETIYSGGQWKHYVIIQIMQDGALIIGPGLNKNGELYIFTGDQPGSFARKGYGTVVAGGIIFVHSLSEALIKSKKLTSSRLRSCVKIGLARVRKLISTGYEGPQRNEENWQVPSLTNLPVRSLKSVDTNDIERYLGPPRANWDTACNIVSGSEIVLRKNTCLQLGNLLTQSPEYAHTLLRLTSRLNNHIAKDNKILSFSIFGGPGSGKSFVAKQIAKAIDPNKERFEYRTFNISQFPDKSRLLDAFKQIQTIGIQGKIPFIMWDEFDTALNEKKAGWLSSFLMPMQDAEFFDGTSNQSLGKCVFVFIGGTFKDDNDFGKWASSIEGREQKGTDFHSRLDSSLTVPSVDFTCTSQKALFVEDQAKLVRAIMLRTFLKKSENIKGISQDVLAFLLHVPLEHGVRSLQKIIIASELSKTKWFELYHLPPIDVLQLHVDVPRLAPRRKISSYINNLKSIYANTKPLQLEWRN